MAEVAGVLITGFNVKFYSFFGTNVMRISRNKFFNSGPLVRRNSVRRLIQQCLSVYFCV
jgi:hypothetical protein